MYYLQKLLCFFKVEKKIILLNLFMCSKFLFKYFFILGGDPKAGTPFEQLIQRLMEADGDPASELWRHPLLVHCKATWWTLDTMTGFDSTVHCPKYNLN